MSGVERLRDSNEQQVPRGPYGPPATPQGRDGEWYWERYTETIVSAEVEPGVWVDLNGEDSVDRVPLGVPLHVLTAWDPGGHPAPAEANRAAQGLLVAELRAAGAALMRSRGRNRDGSFADEGVAVYGLDRSTVKEIGARYGQDAIYELDPAILLLVSCTEDRVTPIPRSGPPDPG